MIGRNLPVIFIWHTGCKTKEEKYKRTGQVLHEQSTIVIIYHVCTTRVIVVLNEWYL